MQNSRNLIVGEHAHRLAMLTYRHTNGFPSAESFGLTSQMRRAAVSIASNIAEGCGRRSNRELLAFLYISAGSASELACQLRIATDLGLGEPSSAGQLSGELQVVARMLNRLITFHRAQPARRRNEGRP